MKAQHWPGPWMISELNDAIDGEEDILIEVEGCPLCTVRGTNDMSCIDDDESIEVINGEVIANAKLIAAAPELLQACQRYMEILKEHYGDMPVFMRPITNGITSAIKKATE